MARAELNAAFPVGDRVLLTKLEDWFFRGMDQDDCEVLRSCIGRTTDTIGFDEYGHAELEFEVAGAGKRWNCHTIWVAQGWLEKV